MRSCSFRKYQKLLGLLQFTLEGTNPMSILCTLLFPTGNGDDDSLTTRSKALGQFY